VRRAGSTATDRAGRPRPKMLQLAREQTAGATPISFRSSTLRGARHPGVGPCPRSRACRGLATPARRRAVSATSICGLLRCRIRQNLVRLGWSDEETDPAGERPPFDAWWLGRDEEIARKLRGIARPAADQVAVSVLTATPERATTAERDAWRHCC